MSGATRKSTHSMSNGRFESPWRALPRPTGRPAACRTGALDLGPFLPGVGRAVHSHFVVQSYLITAFFSHF